MVTRYTLRATHDRKEIMGVAPTGREVTYKAIVIHRISGGKIAEEWGLGTADQFGPIPSLGDAEEMQVFTVPAPEAAG